MSILSEAVHSGTDLVASAIALFSVRASDSPPDPEHPYGHGKIESISGLAEAMLIFGAAIFILYEIVEKLRTPMVGRSHGITVGIYVMAFSMITNFLISRYLYRVARETDSQALQADAAHLHADVLTSLGVLLGLVLVRTTGRGWLDPAVAGIVATLLLFTAYRLTREAVQLLLDTRLPLSEESIILHVLESDSRVLGYHKLRTRKSGAQRHADVHVMIDDNATLIYAHQVTEEIEDAIRTALPEMVITIHIEPFLAELDHQMQVHGIVPNSASTGPKQPHG